MSINTLLMNSTDLQQLQCSFQEAQQQQQQANQQKQQQQQQQATHQHQQQQHQYTTTSHRNGSQNVMDELRIEIGCTQTTTIPNNDNSNKKSVKATTDPSSGTTKLFQVPSVLVLEPKPLGPTPSLFINKNKTMNHRGMVPSEVSDDIDEGIAQAFKEDSEDSPLHIGIDLTGKDDGNVHEKEDDDVVDDVVDLDLEDWTKGVVYEGEDIDICSISSNQDLNPHQNQGIIRMINDDPILLTAATAASLTVVIGLPTKQTLSQSQSQLLLQQRVQHVQQQQQQQLQQLQQRVQQEQQSRVIQQRVQQGQQHRVQQAQAQHQAQSHFPHQVPPPIGRVPLPLQPQPQQQQQQPFALLPPPLPVLLAPPQQQQQQLQHDTTQQQRFTHAHVPPPVMVPQQQQHRTNSMHQTRTTMNQNQNSTMGTTKNQNPIINHLRR